MIEHPNCSNNRHTIASQLSMVKKLLGFTYEEAEALRPKKDELQCPTGVDKEKWGTLLQSEKVALALFLIGLTPIEITQKLNGTVLKRTIITRLSRARRKLGISPNEASALRMLQTQ